MTVMMMVKALSSTVNYNEDIMAVPCRKCKAKPLFRCMGEWGTHHIARPHKVRRDDGAARAQARAKATAGGSPA